MLIAGVMGCCMLGPFINILDTNVVNVALPRMMSGLGTDILTIRWVVTAYLIATAVTMPRHWLDWPPLGQPTPLCHRPQRVHRGLGPVRSGTER